MLLEITARHYRERGKRLKGEKAKREREQQRTMIEPSDSLSPFNLYHSAVRVQHLSTSATLQA